MVKKSLKNKTVINLCHDHISGFLGEALYHFFLKEKLITKKDEKFIVTKKGIEELEIMGIDIDSIYNSTKNNVSICIEHDKGIFYEHIGSPLGALLMNKMVELNWIAKIDENNFELTKKGFEGLKSIGVKMKLFPIFITTAKV